jgi:hypothetical protein
MHLGEECRKEAKAKAKWCVCVCEAEGMSMSESRRGGVARAQHTVSDVQSMMSPVRGGHSAGGARAPSPPPTTPPSTPPATRAVRHDRRERAGAHGGDRWTGWGAVVGLGWVRREGCLWRCWGTILPGCRRSRISFGGVLRRGVVTR